MTEKIYTKINKKLKEKLELVSEWGMAHGVASPFLLHFGIMSVGPLFCEIDEEYGFNMYLAWYNKEGFKTTPCWDENLLKKRTKKLLKNISFLKEKYSEWILYKKEFVSLYDEFKKKENFSKEEFELFTKVYLAEYSRAFYPEYIILYDKFLEPLLEKYGREKVQLAIDSVELPFFIRYKKRLLELALLENKNYQDILNSFHWMQNNYKETEKLTLKDIKVEIKDLRKKSFLELEEELKKLNDRKKNILKAREDLFKICSQEEKNYLEIASLCGKWLDERKELNLKANGVINKYLLQKANQLKINFSQIQFLLPEELKEILKGIKKASDFPLKERMKNCVQIVSYEHGIFLLSGDEYKKISHINPENKKIDATNLIKGQIAMQGKVIGKVSIIENPSNTKKFNKGNILVTGMTRPDFVPLMKKAKAIITDEGGITSHAAIVSRELGKPCIIGTKNATQVLKDGDLVEVDANKGIVRKLS